MLTTEKSSHRFMRQLLLFAVLLVMGGYAVGGDALGGAQELRGMPPRIRLFCSPCFDQYAQELWVRELAWEENPEPFWDRTDGSLRFPPPPPSTKLPDRATVLVDGSPIPADYVYVLREGIWQNLAVALGLPSYRALPSLPPYIAVQSAPIREEPQGLWGR